MNDVRKWALDRRKSQSGTLWRASKGVSNASNKKWSRPRYFQTTFCLCYSLSHLFSRNCRCLLVFTVLPMSWERFFICFLLISFLILRSSEKLRVLWFVTTTKTSGMCWWYITTLLFSFSLGYTLWWAKQLWFTKGWITTVLTVKPLRAWTSVTHTGMYYFSIISLSFLLLFSKCFCFIGRFQRQSHSIPEPSMLWLLSFPAFYRRQHIRKTHIDRYTQIYTDIDTHHTHTGFLSSLRGLKTFAIGLRKLETKTKNSGSMTTMCSRIRMRSKLIYFNGFQLQCIRISSRTIVGFTLV